MRYLYSGIMDLWVNPSQSYDFYLSSTILFHEVSNDDLVVFRDLLQVFCQDSSIRILDLFGKIGSKIPDHHKVRGCQGEYERCSEDC
jgi:hypothetical protein